MTRAGIALDAVTEHGASSRLPGGGPASRWSPGRLAPSAWWWSAVTVVLALAVVALVGLGSTGRLDAGDVAIGVVGLVLVLALVLSWAAGTVREAWLDRARDDVRRYAAGTTVTLRGGPVAGDDRAVAAVEVDGHAAGVLRERAGRGRLGARRTLVLGGRSHTARWASAVDSRTGRRRTVAVRDGSGRVVAEAVRFRPAAARTVDWRVTVAGRDLWLRLQPGREPRRRTLLDDRGGAWLSRPRRGGREHGVHGATTVLPAELGPGEAVAVAWLLAEIEADAVASAGGGTADPWAGLDPTGDPGPSDTGGSNSGGSDSGGSGGDGWW